MPAHLIDFLFAAKEEVASELSSKILLKKELEDCQAEKDLVLKQLHEMQTRINLSSPIEWEDSKFGHTYGPSSSRGSSPKGTPLLSAEDSADQLVHNAPHFELDSSSLNNDSQLLIQQVC